MEDGGGRGRWGQVDGKGRQAVPRDLESHSCIGEERQRGGKEGRGPSINDAHAIFGIFASLISRNHSVLFDR